MNDIYAKINPTMHNQFDTAGDGEYDGHVRLTKEI